MMALVEAMAGMMFPEMDLISNRLFSGMLKMCDLMLAVAATKSIAVASSLSHTKGSSDVLSRSLSFVTHVWNTRPHSSMLQIRLSGMAAS